MEKHKPHCSLHTIKQLVEAGHVCMTGTARTDASRLGFRVQDIIREILRLEVTEFYKSMTTYKEATAWQDVYRHSSAVGMLYIKLTVIDKVLIVSFKEL